MQKKHNKSIIPFAKELRKNMTREEKHLWYDFLKNHKMKFIRQKVIGSYIADFYCAQAKLVIEIDGSQHYDDAGIAYDTKRTEYLESLGISVLRLSNLEVNRNFGGVCENIDEELRQLVGQLARNES